MASHHSFSVFVAEDGSFPFFVFFRNSSLSARMEEAYLRFSDLHRSSSRVSGILDSFAALRLRLRTHADASSSSLPPVSESLPPASGSTFTDFLAAVHVGPAVSAGHVHRVQFYASLRLSTRRVHLVETGAEVLGVRGELVGDVVHELVELGAVPTHARVRQRGLHRPRRKPRRLLAATVACVSGERRLRRRVRAHPAAREVRVEELRMWLARTAARMAPRSSSRTGASNGRAGTGTPPRGRPGWTDSSTDHLGTHGANPARSAAPSGHPARLLVAAKGARGNDDLGDDSIPPGDVGGALDAGGGGRELVEVVDGGDEGEIVGAEGREGTGDERVDVGEGERAAFAVDVVAVLVVCERSESGEGDVRGVRDRADAPKPVTGRVASVHFQSRRRVVAADASGDARRRRAATREGRRNDARRKMSSSRPRSIASAMFDGVRRARVSGVTVWFQVWETGLRKTDETSADE